MHVYVHCAFATAIDLWEIGLISKLSIFVRTPTATLFSKIVWHTALTWGVARFQEFGSARWKNVYRAIIRHCLDAKLPQTVDSVRFRSTGLDCSSPGLVHCAVQSFFGCEKASGEPWPGYVRVSSGGLCTSPTSVEASQPEKVIKPEEWTTWTRPLSTVACLLDPPGLLARCVSTARIEVQVRQECEGIDNGDGFGTSWPNGQPNTRLKALLSTI